MPQGENASVRLGRGDLNPNPYEQFSIWYELAVAAHLIADPSAMTLATATLDGSPSARMVLLKGCDERGFLFYTDFESQKGHELAVNPRAALVLYWAELGQQVRVTGDVRPASREETTAYFRTRPRGSQLAAWASRQSRVISSRDVLDRRMGEYAATYTGLEVPVPPWWGGFRVVPRVVEFWQHRPDRLHDRFRYELQSDGTWLVERLAP